MPIELVLPDWYTYIPSERLVVLVIETFGLPLTAVTETFGVEPEVLAARETHSLFAYDKKLYAVKKVSALKLVGLAKRFSSSVIDVTRVSSPTGQIGRAHV